MLELGIDARSFAKVKVAAVGEATTRAVREQLCLNVDLTPTRFVANALSDELERLDEVKGKRSSCSGPTSHARSFASACRMVGRRRLTTLPFTRRAW